MSIKVGNPYEKGNIIKDRELIEKVLRDKGYYVFSREYINVNVDTGAAEPITKADSLLYKEKPDLFSSYGLDVTLTVQNPENGYHKSYAVDKISMTLNESDSSKIGIADIACFTC